MRSKRRPATSMRLRKAELGLDRGTLFCRALIDCASYLCKSKRFKSDQQPDAAVNQPV